MKKVIIIGCNGFIGSKLSSFLKEKNIKIVGVDLTKSNNSQIDEFYSINDFLSDDCNMEKFNDTDVVYHLAWNGVSTADKDNYKKQFFNIEFTYEILKKCNQIKPKRIVIPGSTSEFGGYNTPITGNEKDNPTDLYAATKVAIRKISYQYCKKNELNLNWLLITSIYGEGRNDSNLITYTIKSLLNNDVVKCTKLEQKRNYLYIDDLLSAMYLIGEKGESNTIYPIGSNENKTLRSYVEDIARELNKCELLEIGAIPYKNKFIDNSIIDISKLSNIGYKPRYNFADKISDVIEYFKGLKE